ncbi:uncharacterized protein LOC135717554 [Ochlerotatus camptorhynchus]|uniref:uncharacterized protein LOC135699450 n=1 Tax=Ochlerotatus camptorhynchus TaxID=644619 RepID=UPI0031D9A623
MELLKEGGRPKETIRRQITALLCDCLKSLYGTHASNFYKNQIALSLVETYPALSSKNAEIPQSLWFHPHGRGLNRHAGSVYYRMENVARQSDERIIKRRKLGEFSHTNEIDATLEQEDDNMEDLVLELKFIVPNVQSKVRIVELWEKTFASRQQKRTAGTLVEYLKDFPVIGAFNGELIKLEFTKIKPGAKSFTDHWEELQNKILKQYADMFVELKNSKLRLKLQ